MAKNAVATAWIQILPSLDGLHSALVRASKGEVLTPQVKPVATAASMGASKLGRTFSTLFGATANKGMLSSFQSALGRITGQFSKAGSTGGQQFSKGFSGYIGDGGIGTYLRLGAASAGIAVLGRQIGNIGSQIVSMGNQWGRSLAMIQNAVGATGDWRKELKNTADAASQIGVPIKNIAEESARLVQLAPKTIPNYKTATKFTKLFAMNMVSTGASTEEASNAMRQITQALGKGIVNGDELNSIMENSPQIAQMLAKHLNVSVGELKELGAKGKISGDALRDAVLENAKKIETQFEKMPVTADRALQMVVNDFIVGGAEASTKLSEALGDGLKQIGKLDLAQSIGAGLQGLLPLFKSIGTAIGSIATKLAPAIKAAFDPKNIEAFMQPFTDFFNMLSEMSMDDLVNAVKTFGVVASVAFSGILGGSDKFLKRIPLIGGALSKVKNIVVGVGGAIGAAMGEGVNASGKLITKLGGLLEKSAGLWNSVGRVDKAVRQFGDAVNSVDMDVWKDTAMENIVQMFKKMNAGAIETNTAVEYLGDLFNDLSNYGLVAPKNLVAAFESLKKTVNDASNSTDTLHAKFQQLPAALENITRTSQNIATVLKYDFSGKAASGLYDSIAKEVQKLTGIKIPDFLTPAISQIVASSVNGFKAFTKVVDTVGNKAGQLLHKGLTSAMGKLHFNTSAFNGIVNGISSSLGKANTVVSDKAKTFGSEFVAGFKTQLNNIPPEITQTFSKLKSISGRIAAPMTNAFKGSFSALGATLGKVQSRFGSFKKLGVAAMRAIGSAATKIAGKSLQGLGKAVSGVGKMFGGLGRMASRLGVSSALFAGLTAGFTALWKANPADMGKVMDGFTQQVTSMTTKVATQLPAMANAVTAALPGLVSAITTNLPQMLSAVGQAFSTLAPAIMQQLPAIFSAVQNIFTNLVSQIPSFLPGLLQGFTTLITMLVDALPGLMSGIGQAFINVFTTVSEQLPVVLPKLIQSISNMMTEIGKQLPEFAQQLSDALPTLITGLSKGLIDQLPTLMQGITNLVTGIIQMLPTLIPVLVQGAFTLINDLVANLPDIIQPIIDALPTVIQSLIQALTDSLPVIIDGLTTLMQNLVTALPQIMQALVDALPQILTSVVDALVDALPILIDGVLKMITSLAEQLPTLIQKIIDILPSLLITLGDTLISNFPKIIDAVGKGIVQVAKALPSLIVAVINAIPKILVSIAGAFASLGSKILDHIKDIPDKIKGLFNGAGSWLIDAGKAILNGLLGGLHSAWENVTGFVGGIGNWIVKNKGPLSYDKRMLIPAGLAIMNGLNRGLVNGFGGVKNTVGTITGQMRDQFTMLDSSFGKLSTPNYRAYAGNANTYVTQNVEQNFPAKIVRANDDLYTAYPQLYRAAKAELGGF